MKTFDTFIAIAYVLTNVVALVQVIGTYRWPTVTRLVFFVLFAMAAVVNIRTALDTPWVYQSYAYYALPVYSWFILGPFDAITQPMVISIAIGQIGIATSMLLLGRWFRLGCVGGLVFCVSIAPLGLGSAFPATLLMALAFYRLFKHENQQPRPIGPVAPKRNVASAVE